MSRVYCTTMSKNTAIVLNTTMGKKTATVLNISKMTAFYKK